MPILATDDGMVLAGHGRLADGKLLSTVFALSNDCRLGSKCEELRVSKSGPRCPNKQTWTSRGVTSLVGQSRK